MPAARRPLGHRGARTLVAAAVVTAVPALACVAAVWTAQALATTVRRGGASPEDVVLLGIVAALASACAWATVCAASGSAVALSRATGSAPAVAAGRGVGPVAIACALVLALAGPASAAATPSAAAPSSVVTLDDADHPADLATHDPTADTATDPPTRHLSDRPAPVPGGWLPRVAASATDGGGGGDHTSGTSGSGAHVVMRGDTLWSIAADHLGPDATEGDIAAEWPRWWRANHHVIGDDPDRILPGQTLHPPDAPTAAPILQEAP